MARLVSQELPIFTLTYDFDARAHTTDLEGPRWGVRVGTCTSGDGEPSITLRKS